MLLLSIVSSADWRAILIWRSVHMVAIAKAQCVVGAAAWGITGLIAYPAGAIHLRPVPGLVADSGV